MARQGATSRSRRLVRLGIGGMVVAGLATASLQTDVIGRMAAGEYDAARAAIGTLAAPKDEDPRVEIWRQRLVVDPGEALDLAAGQVRDRDLPLAQRVQAALDGATIALAQDDLTTAWRLIQPLMEFPPDQIPGEMYLIAGRILHLSGDRQQARAMLASVRPQDPAFVAARAMLGRLGLENGDNELALRYFESAAGRQGEDASPELLVGAWQALQLLGRDVEARDVATRLLDTYPTSLAAVELRELQRREDEQFAAIADSLDVEAPEVLDEPEPGLYTVQLAAFRDRALALLFVQRWQVELPDLEIRREMDDLGQPLYKVQTGRFVSHAQARTELARLERRHGLEGFVAGGTGR